MAEIVTMPKLGFDMAEGTLVRWVILEGEPVASGAILAEIETDKATVEVESQFEGIVVRHLIPVGEIVPINTPIAIIAAQDENVDIEQLLGEESLIGEITESAQDTQISPGSKTTDTTDVETTDTKVGGKLPGGIKASPLARRIANEIGIDLRVVKGTGTGGRITKSDVESYITVPSSQTSQAPISEGVPIPQPAFQLTPPPDAPVPASQEIPLHRLRAVIGRRMKEAKQQVPHFYVTHEYDMQTLMQLRKQVNSLLPDDQKISVNDFIVKAVAITLRQFPNLNASLQDDHVIYHGPINIGVAVAVEGGLLTVVCQNTDRKTLPQIGSELRTKIGRARKGKVRPDDIEGSTFSVSNMGMFDVENFIAIINPPEAAILAVGSARQVPVVENGKVVPGLRMKATISVDHRVSDGVEAARFLQAIAIYLEEPLQLLF
jgi:pyruvate dehydrogenase E2 component (dihydrolipoamide acetyltransferase)